MFTASLLGGWLFPWWWPALTGFALGCMYSKSSGSAFVTGFLGSALSWLTYAVYLNWRNHHLLAARIAELFHLPAVAAVLASTALLGGLAGGLGAYVGYAWGRYLKAG